MRIANSRSKKWPPVGVVGRRPGRRSRGAGCRRPSWARRRRRGPRSARRRCWRCQRRSAVARHSRLDLGLGELPLLVGAVAGQALLGGEARSRAGPRLVGVGLGDVEALGQHLRVGDVHRLVGRLPAGHEQRPGEAQHHGGRHQRGQRGGRSAPQAALRWRPGSRCVDAHRLRAGQGQQLLAHAPPGAPVQRPALALGGRGGAPRGRAPGRRGRPRTWSTSSGHRVAPRAPRPALDQLAGVLVAGEVALVLGRGRRTARRRRGDGRRASTITTGRSTSIASRLVVENTFTSTSQCLISAPRRRGLRRRHVAAQLAGTRRWARRGARAACLRSSSRYSSIGSG